MLTRKAVRAMAAGVALTVFCAGCVDNSPPGGKNAPASNPDGSGTTGPSQTPTPAEQDGSDKR